MINQPRKFCENQIVCEDDEGRGTYTCLGDLAEGRALQCPYSESDIKFRNRLGLENEFYIQKIPRPGADGVCTDFEISEEVKKDLSSKVTQFKKQ